MSNLEISNLEISNLEHFDDGLTDDERTIILDYTNEYYEIQNAIKNSIDSLNKSAIKKWINSLQPLTHPCLIRQISGTHDDGDTNDYYNELTRMKKQIKIINKNSNQDNVAKEVICIINDLVNYTRRWLLNKEYMHAAAWNTLKMIENMVRCKIRDKSSKSEQCDEWNMVLCEIEKYIQIDKK